MCTELSNTLELHLISGREEGRATPALGLHHTCVTLTSCARSIHEQEELSARLWTPQSLNEKLHAHPQAAPCTPSSGIGSLFRLRSANTSCLALP